MKAVLAFTPPESRTLIAKAVWESEEMQNALHSGTIAIGADNTTVYIIREFLQKNGLDSSEPVRNLSDSKELLRKYLSLGTKDSWVIRDGKLLQGYKLLSVINEFQGHDVFLKGGNALDPDGFAGTFVGEESGAAVQVAMGTVLAKGAHFIVPVGLERAVFTSVIEIGRQLGIRKIPRASGEPVGFVPLPGRVFTEIVALKILANVEATHVGAGGSHGAEGSICLHIEGEEKDVLFALDYTNSIKEIVGNL